MSEPRRPRSSTRRRISSDPSHRSGAQRDGRGTVRLSRRVGLLVGGLDRRRTRTTSAERCGRRRSLQLEQLADAHARAVRFTLAELRTDGPRHRGTNGGRTLRGAELFDQTHRFVATESMRALLAQATQRRFLPDGRTSSSHTAAGRRGWRALLGRGIKPRARNTSRLLRRCTTAAAGTRAFAVRSRISRPLRLRRSRLRRPAAPRRELLPGLPRAAGFASSSLSAPRFKLGDAVVGLYP